MRGDPRNANARKGASKREDLNADLFVQFRRGSRSRPRTSQPAHAEPLHGLGISVALTTYQASKLVLLRAEEGTINTHFRSFPKPMRLAVSRAARDWNGGRYEPIVSLPGFTRGVDFHGRYAFIRSLASARVRRKYAKYLAGPASPKYLILPKNFFCQAPLGCNVSGNLA